MIKGSDKNASIWKLNEEAAREAAIQIRLRNLSGIIIIDFINMESLDEEERLIQLMQELVKTDLVHTKVVDITPLGLMEITRKKVYKSLKEQFH
jgi:ribonuclease G